MLIDSNLMQARGGRPDVQAVYTLRHFFPMTETSGSVVTDIKSGVVLQPAEISFFDNMVRPHEPLGSYNAPTEIPAPPLAAGKWTDLGTDSFCHMALGVLDVDTDPNDGGGGIGFGENKGAGDRSEKTGIGISVTNALISGVVNVSGGTGDDHYTARPTEASGVADGVNGDLFLLDLRAERKVGNGSVYYRRVNITKGTSEEQTELSSEDGITSFADATTCTPDPFGRMRGIRLLGVTLFQFSGAIPSNYPDAVDDMVSAWQQRNKTISPLAVAWR